MKVGILRIDGDSIILDTNFDLNFNKLINVDTPTVSGDGVNKAYVDAQSGGISNVVEDLTPQLGGDLDINGKKIVSVSNGNIEIVPNGTGDIVVSNGNFIIGTSVPSEKLQVDGSILIRPDAESTRTTKITNLGTEPLLQLINTNVANQRGGFIEFDGNTGSVGSFISSIDTRWNGTLVSRIGFLSGSDTANKDDGKILFYTASAGSVLERMRIETDGSIGFGTSNPGTAYFFNGKDIRIDGGFLGLDVTPTSHFHIMETSNTTPIQLFFEHASGSGANRRIEFITDANPSLDNDILFDIDSRWNGTTVGNIRILAGNDTGNKDNGQIRFYTASAGSTLERIMIDEEGNFGIGTSIFGTAAAGIIGIGNGTAPTTSPANMIQLYSEDVSASSELKVRDEAGNITVLSPHNFSLTNGPSEEMAWSYYSERNGKAINVDMLKLARVIENLSGEKLVNIKNIME